MTKVLKSKAKKPASRTAKSSTTRLKKAPAKKPSTRRK